VEINFEVSLYTHYYFDGSSATLPQDYVLKEGNLRFLLSRLSF